MSLEVNGKLKLPRDATGWVIAYLAKRGAGKTYCAAVQAEEMIKAGIPIVVIDGMGIWWGLRVERGGYGDGLPVVVFGGEHADFPLQTDRSKDMAAAIVQTNINCVIDVSELSKGQALKFVGTFLAELYRLNRADRHVLIEEADLWAPQRTMSPDEAICLGAVDNFVRRGGNRNLGCTLITQRPAVLNKNVLTQADCLVVLRTLAPQDKKAIQAWVAEQTDSSGDAKWYDSLKGLKNGEAYVWHPENPAIFEQIQFRERETFHATREFIKTPQAAKIRLMPVEEFKERYRRVFEGEPVKVVIMAAAKQAVITVPREAGPTLRQGKPNITTDTNIDPNFILTHPHEGRCVTGIKEISATENPDPGTTLTVESPEEIDLHHKATRINVSHSDKHVDLSTESRSGQLVYVLLNDRQGQPTSASEVSRLAEEHGWTLDRRHLGDYLAGTKGAVIFDGTTYRLAKFVRVEVGKA